MAQSQGFIVPAHPRLHRAQADGGAFAQAGEQVIGHLRVEGGARHVLKAEQAHGLLMQFVHGGAAPLAGRKQQRGEGRAHRRGLVQALEDEAQGQGRGVRRDHGRGKQIHGSRLEA